MLRKLRFRHKNGFLIKKRVYSQKVKSITFQLQIVNDDIALNSIA